MARPGLSQAHKDQAEDALAEDYLSAGLFDRAENLFRKLCDSDEYRVKALHRLLRIYEVTREWDRAIETQAELDRAGRAVGRQATQSSQVAQYYCELADQARQEHDIVRAREMLKRAEGCREPTVRSLLAHADLDADTGKHKDAVRRYQKFVKQAPGLLVDVVRRLFDCYRELDDAEGFSRYLRKLIESDQNHIGAVAIATIRDPEIDDPVALHALLQFVAADETLSRLIGIERVQQLPEPERTETLGEIRQALRAILARKPGYHCTDCGYSCLALQWQCPGCRAWETVAPDVRVQLG